MTELPFEGHGGETLRATLFVPAAPSGAAVVLVQGGGDGAAEVTALAEALAGAGLSAAVPALGERAASDRRAAADLERLAARLQGDGPAATGKLGVVGFGRGGTLAFLAACRSSRFAALAVCRAPLVHPELSAERPVQPLEMALGLDAPLLGLFAPDDPATPPADVELLRERMAAFARSAEIEPLDGDSDARARILAFLTTHLA